MLQFLIFIVHFNVFDGAAYPYKPIVDRSLLTRVHMETKGCFTIEQLYQWRSVIVYTMGILRQTEAIRLTAGDGGPSTGFQTHSNA